ncbi:HAD hydrolase family protein [bacterium]|nr:HAD hydrolase family protein [bacterium]
MDCPGKNIKLLALDVDGILTDGRIMIDSEGREIKVFSAHDGMGIKAALQAGIKIAFITSRNSKAVLLRARELGVADVYVGRTDKITAVKELTDKYSIDINDVCYMGDDLVDLQAIAQAGWGVTVPEAPEVIRYHSDFVTTRSCGCGAVREVIEIILKSKGLWDNLINSFLG